jgi:type IV secretion system protein TrbF
MIGHEILQEVCVFMEVDVEAQSISSTVVSEARVADAIKEPLNPYLAARREWDERYGDLITRARNWRLIALVCALAGVLQTAGLIVLSLRAKVIPYVVAVDSIGHTVSEGPAEETSATDDRFERATLLDWIENLRTVTADGITQRKCIDRVYTRIANGSPALGVINEFYRSHPPQHRAETESISVDVQSVLATSDKTFQIEWTETTRDLQGMVKAQERWKGAFTIVIRPPSDERQIRANPLGLYITNASWTRIL